MRTCIIASISAMSVPGSGWTNWSAASAVSVRIGSITTTLAPSARAASIVGHRWRLVSRVLVPHSRISLRVAQLQRVERRAPMPFVIRTPAPTVGPQIAAQQRGWRRGGGRTGRDAHQSASRLWLPASLNGRIASAAVLGDRRACSRVADLGERVVPRDLLELARCPSGRCGAAGAGRGRGCRRGRGSG